MSLGFAFAAISTIMAAIGAAILRARNAGRADGRLRAKEEARIEDLARARALRRRVDAARVLFPDPADARGYRRD